MSTEKLTPTLRMTKLFGACLQRSAMSNQKWKGALAAIFLCLVFFVLAYGQAIPTARTAPIVDDETTFWMVSQLALHGHIQYLSYVADYMPLNFYMGGAVSYLFGGDVPALRIAAFCFNLLFSPLVIYAITRKLSGSTAFGLIALAIYLLLGCSPLFKGFAFLIFLWALVAERFDERYTQVRTGLALAFCFFSGQEFGVYASCTLFSYSLLEIAVARPDWRPALVAQIRRCIGFLALALPPVLLYLVTGSFGSFFYNAIYRAFVATRGWYNLPYPWSVDLHDPHNWKYYAFPLVPVLALRIAVSEARTPYGRKVFALTVAFCMTFITALDYADQGHIAMGILVLPILVAIILYDAFSRKRSVSDAVLPPAITLAGVVFLGAEIWILYDSEQRYTFQAFLAMASTIAMALWVVQTRSAETWRPFSRPLLLGVLIVVSLTFFQHSTIEGCVRRIEDLGFNGASVKAAFTLPPAGADSIVGLQLPADQLHVYAELRQVVQELTAPDDPIVLFPRHSYLFSYLGRQNATKIYQYLPSMTRKEVNGVIEGLLRRPPRLVIYEPMLASLLGTDLNLFFLRHYRVARQIASFEILVPHENNIIDLSRHSGGFIPDTNVHEYIYANYLKPMMFKDEQGHELLTLFQHPPYAKRITLDSELALLNLKALQIFVSRSPEFPNTSGESQVWLEDVRGERLVALSQKFEANGKGATLVEYPVPSDVIVKKLILESTLAHGTHWRILAKY
jgi:hypothetical protein